MSARAFGFLLVLAIGVLVLRIFTAESGGDSIAWGVLAFFVALDGGIWLGAKWLWERDPARERIAQMRADLELDKARKASRIRAL